MKSFITFVRLVVLASTFVAAGAHADPMPFTSVLVSTDQTQGGRLSRNGVPQDFDGSEPYPGVINPTASYHFHAYSVSVGATPYVLINFDSNSPTTFLSVYDSVYRPSNLAAGWLGDAGTSGNYFGTDPIAVGIHAALNSVIVLVVNESITNGGLNMPFTFIVQGYTDRDYSNGVDLQVNANATVIPEPPTVLLLAAPLVAAGAFSRRRRVAKAASIA